MSPLCVMRGCRVCQQDRSVPSSYSITCRDCWKARTPPSHVIAMCTMWRAFSSSSCGSCHAHLFLVTTGHCWRPASACYQPRTSQGHCSWQLFSSPPYASRFVDSSPSQRLTRPCCMHVAMSESCCMHVAMLHANLLHANHACLSLPTIMFHACCSVPESCCIHVAVSQSCSIHVCNMIQGHCNRSCCSVPVMLHACCSVPVMLHACCSVPVMLHACCSVPVMLHACCSVPVMLHACCSLLVMLHACCSVCVW